ncbi:MAG: hypothetical protein GC201_12910 [Alphaproteobacteria bacterium]|nr:hypothetical protein [Alphaproteobacteria bacterium]
MIIVSAALAGFSVGAHAADDWRQGDTSVERCAAEFNAIDNSVRTAGVQDAEYARIDGFPYFRIDRFLASYDFSKFKPAERTEWVDQLVANDQEARTIEIGNLPATERGELYARLGRDPLKVLSDCAETMRKYDHEHPQAHKALAQQAKVPVSDPVPQRPTDWTPQELTAMVSPEPVKDTGPLVTAFEPVATAPILASAAKVLVERSRTDALGIPLPDDDVADRLIAGFAPVWLVKGRPDDGLVIPAWDKGKAEGEEYQAAVYSRLSHVKWNGKVLLQISYFAWFNDDPLDGVIWRVTIGPDGRPVLYDTVRTDGSDYLVIIPGDKLKTAGRSVHIGDVPEGERVAVTVDQATRKVTHVGFWGGVTRGAYVLTEYDRLRRLYDHAGETRSLFGPSGAMTPDKAGSPRQWGHERLPDGRYFDAPDLYDGVKPAS